MSLKHFRAARPGLLRAILSQEDERPLPLPDRDEAPPTPFRLAPGVEKRLSASQCPELHAIYAQVQARKKLVDQEILDLTRRLDLLRAEREALAPAWHTMSECVVCAAEPEPEEAEA
jgi:hypothetical protein